MKTVKIVEVGLRDGLQNESSHLTINNRYDLYDKLVQAGVKHIEVGAFVSPKWVPQMSVTAELSAMILAKAEKKKKKVFNSVLVPNEKGMLMAIQAGFTEVAIFAACTESFSVKNINCSIDESFKRFEPIMRLAKKFKIKVRGYLSTAMGCPFEGVVSEKKVINLVKRMHKLGCYEISVGDTIGAATPQQVQHLFKKLKKTVPVKKLAAHFHDTRGQAVANTFAAYQVGIRVFDSSVGGLGGCPYAPGATGNVATEDLVYMFEGMKVSTNINLDKLVQANHWLEPLMNHPLPTRAGKVGKLKATGKSPNLE